LGFLVSCLDLKLGLHLSWFVHAIQKKNCLGSFYDHDNLNIFTSNIYLLLLLFLLSYLF
jgi:hypothetical protein